MPDVAYWALPKLSPEEINHDRSKVLGAILRRIDWHAASLGAGHAAHYERAEFDERHLEITFEHLQTLEALIRDAKEKIAELESITPAPEPEKEEQP